MNILSWKEFKNAHPRINVLNKLLGMTTTLPSEDESKMIHRFNATVQEVMVVDSAQLSYDQKLMSVQEFAPISLAPGDMLQVDFMVEVVDLDKMKRRG
jgi:hypothetical protein